jgi:hypothetical protein
MTNARFPCTTGQTEGKILGSLMANSLSFLLRFCLAIYCIFSQSELWGRNIGKLATSVNFSPSGNGVGKGILAEGGWVLGTFVTVN